MKWERCNIKVTPHLWGCPPGKIHMRAILKENMANYISLERLINVDFRKKYELPVFQFRKKNRKQPQKWQCVIQPPIGYQIQVHWQNNCTVFITMDQSSSIFYILTAYFLLICQVQQRIHSACFIEGHHRWNIIYFKNPWHTLVSQHLRNV